jgi:tetratricopeptide (TPR) repeat protein
MIDFDRAIALNPKNVHALINRGSAKTHQGHWDEAIKDYEQVIQLQPTNATVFNNLGWAKFQEGDFDGAIAAATAAIQINSTNAYGYGTRGWARYGKGDAAGALTDCKTAIILNGTNVFLTAYDQGLIDFINSDFAQATASWQKVVEHDSRLNLELKPWIEKARMKSQEQKK